MPGRRWSDGLHQAIEAKEGVKIENENQTLATITFQNYFRMYEKLAGMTGTADTEAEEFHKIYKLDVRGHPDQPADGPPRLPGRRLQDRAREVQRGRREIKELHEPGPAGPGRHDLDREVRAPRRSCSSKAGIPHDVLNAKQHEREAEIVAQAGRKGTVTIATNMAGRGTDILLGGNPEMPAQCKLSGGHAQPEADARGVPRQRSTSYAVAVRPESTTRWSQLGGLHILGTERHEARRIDNQLRGRAGRQGDPGSSRSTSRSRTT